MVVTTSASTSSVMSRFVHCRLLDRARNDLPRSHEASYFAPRKIMVCRKCWGRDQYPPACPVRTNIEIAAIYLVPSPVPSRVPCFPTALSIAPVVHASRYCCSSSRVTLLLQQQPCTRRFINFRAESFFFPFCMCCALSSTRVSTSQLTIDPPFPCCRCFCGVDVDFDFDFDIDDAV